RQHVLGEPRDRAELGQRHVLADDRRGLEQALLLGRKAVDARGEDGLYRPGQLHDRRGPREAIGTALAREHARLRQSAYALLEEEGIALRPRDQEGSERRQLRIGAQKDLDERVGRSGRERIETDLAVIGLTSPAVAVLGAIVDQQEEAIGRQAL